VIPHLQEHLFHISDSKRPFPPAEIFVQYDELADRDLVTLDQVRFGKVGVHVADKGAGNDRR
jgi:hypothetical protein